MELLGDSFTKQGPSSGGAIHTVCPPVWDLPKKLTATIPTSARDLPSDGEGPPIDHDGLRTFPTKHVA